MAGKTRSNPEQLADRRREAYVLREILGQPLEVVAAKLKVTERQARRYIAEAATDIRSKGTERQDVAVHQVALIMEAQKECYQAFLQSKAKKVTRTAGVEQQGVKSGDHESGAQLTKKKTGHKEEDRIGDPAWIKLIYEGTDRITKLLGLDPATVQRLLKEKLAEALGQDVEDLNGLSTEEILRRYQEKVLRAF